MGNIYDNNRITLDLSIHRIVNVYCVEGDINSRRIIITLTNDGQPYELSDNIYVSYKVRKPDGNIIHNPITDIIDGEIYIDLDEQCTIKKGLAHAELMLINIDENNIQSIASMPFNIIIKESTVNNTEIESTSEFNTLVECIAKAETVAEDVNGAVAESKKNADDTKNYAANAKLSESSASNSASIATTKATDASNSSISASNSASTATTKANEAKTSADNAKNYATQSQSYAVGGTGTRNGEDADNSKYYYQHSKEIYDDFIKNNVTGVKGSAESTYRKGNVEITKANIGLENVENKSSTTIRNEITDNNVINALGFTPIAKEDTSTEVISDNEPTGQAVGDFWLQSY